MIPLLALSAALAQSPTEAPPHPATEREAHGTTELGFALSARRVRRWNTAARVLAIGSLATSTFAYAGLATGDNGIGILSLVASPILSTGATFSAANAAGVLERAGGNPSRVWGSLGIAATAVQFGVPVVSLTSTFIGEGSRAPAFLALYAALLSPIPATLALLQTFATERHLGGLQVHVALAADTPTLGLSGRW